MERRDNQNLAGRRAGGLHARTIEILDQRGIADRFFASGQIGQVAGFNMIRLDISDFPAPHPYGLALTQNHFERILSIWVDELGVPIYRGREVEAFAQDATGVDVRLNDDTSLRAAYIVGCDGGRSVIGQSAGMEFSGWEATMSWLLAEVEMTESPKFGFHKDSFGVHAIGPLENGHTMGVVLTERQV